MFTNSNLFSYEEGKALNQDIEIYYRDYGPINAEPILLIQGLGGQLVNWPQPVSYTHLTLPTSDLV